MSDNYNQFCASKGCEYYIEWSCPYPCVSCKRVGQSYNITEYPDDCPYLEEIKLVPINHQTEGE